VAKKNDGEVDGKKIIAKNRRAFHDYHVLEQVEAGLVLQGTEVKSLRAGHVVVDEAYARIMPSGEALILDLQIQPYDKGTYANHKIDRPRRLLLHRREIAKIKEKIETEGLTIIPLELYFKRGFAKVMLGVGKGKKLHDKRQSLREKDDRREMQRAMRGKGGRDDD
jgi:SsrA-binding protein